MEALTIPFLAGIGSSAATAAPIAGAAAAPVVGASLPAAGASMASMAAPAAATGVLGNLSKGLDQGMRLGQMAGLGKPEEPTPQMVPMPQAAPAAPPRVVQSQPFTPSAVAALQAFLNRRPM